MTKKADNKFEPQNHVLVPLHEMISKQEEKELFEKYNLILDELPRISIKDSAIAHFDAKVGNIIKITRTNKTAHKTIFYRRVIDE